MKKLIAAFSLGVMAIITMAQVQRINTPSTQSVSKNAGNTVYAIDSSVTLVTNGNGSVGISANGGATNGIQQQGGTGNNITLNGVTIASNIIGSTLVLTGAGPATIQAATVTSSNYYGNIGQTTNGPAVSKAVQSADSTWTGNKVDSNNPKTYAAKPFSVNVTNTFFTSGLVSADDYVKFSLEPGFSWNERGHRVRPIKGFCGWPLEGMNVDQAHVLADISKMATYGYVTNGYNIFQLDGAWYALSNWAGTTYTVCDSNRFPNGIRFISDTLATNGLKLGLLFTMGHFDNDSSANGSSSNAYNGTNFTGADGCYGKWYETAWYYQTNIHCYYYKLTRDDGNTTDEAREFARYFIKGLQDSKMPYHVDLVTSASAPGIQSFVDSLDVRNDNFEGRRVTDLSNAGITNLMDFVDYYSCLTNFQPYGPSKSYNPCWRTIYTEDQAYNYIPYKGSVSMWALLSWEAMIVQCDDVNRVLLDENPEVLDIQNDPLMIPARPITQPSWYDHQGVPNMTNNIQWWVKPLERRGTDRFAVGAWNRTIITSGNTSNAVISMQSLGIPSGNWWVRDVWAHTSYLNTSNTLNINVTNLDCALFTLTKDVSMAGGGLSVATNIVIQTPGIDHVTGNPPLQYKNLGGTENFWLGPLQLSGYSGLGFYNNGTFDYAQATLWGLSDGTANYLQSPVNTGSVGIREPNFNWWTFYRNGTLINTNYGSMPSVPVAQYGGAAAIWNSNGTVYLLSSGPHSTAWTATNNLTLGGTNSGGGGSGFTAVWATNEYWVSAIGGGSQDGSSANPYDGSTQAKFDAVMRNLVTNNYGGVYVHLMDGTFTTAGQFDGAASSWPLFSNTKITGNGAGHTIVKLKNNPGVGASIFLTSFGPSNPLLGGGALQTNIEIGNLTCDINGDNGTPNASASGISLVCKNPYIHNVEVIGGYGTFSQGAEGFGISVGGSDYNASSTNILVGSSAIIENCFIQKVSTNCDYFNGITAFELQSPQIHGNLSVYPLSTNHSKVFHHFAAAACIDANIYGNVAYGGTEGFYSDTDFSAKLGLTNVMLHDNSFYQVDTGWMTQPSQSDPGYGFKAYNNIVKLNSWGNSASFSLAGFTMFYNFTNIEVYGNTFIGPDRTGTNYYICRIGGDPTNSANYVRIHDNTWDSGANNQGVNLGTYVTNFYIYNNRYPDGSLASNVSQTNNFDSVYANYFNVSTMSISTAIMTNVYLNLINSTNLHNLAEITNSVTFDALAIFTNGITSSNLAANATEQFGSGAVANATLATALGYQASATGSGASALGSSTAAAGQNSLAVGSENNADAQGSIAIGDSAHAFNQNDMAIGKLSLAKGTNSMAIGVQASVPFTDQRSTALGYRAIVTAADQIMLGQSNTVVVAPNILNAQTYDTPTNTFTINGAFAVGTNAYYTGGAQTGGITGIQNGPSSTARYGELTIVATGDIVFTNPVSMRTSDFLSSRTITNGNTAVIAIEVLPTFTTNMAIVQFK